MKAVRTKVSWVSGIVGLLVAGACAMLVSEVAHAHTRLMSPTPRNNSDGLKSGPCGGVARTANPLVLTAGQQLKVDWEETIDHPGRYILAFSAANDANFTVINNNLPDQQGAPLPHRYTTTITVPNTPCTACTLQLIQSMEENPAAPSYYYSCADIRIQAASATPTPTPTPPPTPTPTPTSTPTPAPTPGSSPTATPVNGGGGQNTSASTSGGFKKPEMESGGCGMISTAAGGGGGPRGPGGGALPVILLSLPSLLAIALRRIGQIKQS